MVSRRMILTAGAGAVSIALIGRFDSGGPIRTIRIAGGQPGGFYLEFARLLAEQVNATWSDLRGTDVPTAGSVENLELLRDRQADIAVVQADIALTAVAGQNPFDSAIPICGIGRVYEDYLQLVVRADGPLRAVTDLAGRVVSIGADGSGTVVLSKRLINAAGFEVIPALQPLAESIEALEHRTIDALFWVGGVPTPALAELHRRIGIRILPITDPLTGLLARYGNAYQPVRLPPGGYGQGDAPTIGVANLLVCAENLPDDLAGAVARTLVECAAQLVPPQALGTQFLDPHTLIHTLGISMHPAAANAYRQMHG